MISAADQSDRTFTTEELWEPASADVNGGGGDHVGDTRFGDIVVTRQADLVLDSDGIQEHGTKREPKAVLVSTHTFEDPYDVLAEVSTAEYLRGRYGVPTLHGVVRSLVASLSPTLLIFLSCTLRVSLL